MKKISLLLIILFYFQLVLGQNKYKHILITNDDGIEDADRLLALAENVSSVTDRVSIIVSAFDRSGTSNHTAFGKYQSTFEVTCKYTDEDKNIAVYTIPGNPADCVVLGIGGFFGEDKPDLVLSGINGGSNIGPDWFGSGTIGAIRMAAFLGTKGIALSGFEDDYKKSFTIIPNWITKFISSGFIDNHPQKSYLTIGFPEIPPGEIKGVKVLERRIAFDKPEVIQMKKIYGEAPHVEDNKTIWTLEYTGNPNSPSTRFDDYYLNQGFIVVTPMTIDENDEVLMKVLQGKVGMIPEFDSKTR